MAAAETKSSNDDLAGKVCLVTGGGTGIGLACAQLLVESGASVVISGRRAPVLAAAVEKLGAASSWLLCDVCDEQSIEAAVDRVMNDHGRLDMAVNSAGVSGAGSLLNLDTAAFDAIVRTNMVGLYASMRAEARAMLKGARGGAIVNISSIAAVLSHKGMPAYCASKAGVNMLTRCFADDLGHKSIRVNAVMPGLVATDLTEQLTAFEPAVDLYREQMPLGRVGQTREIAEIVLMLLSSRASWVTGQCIAVDGGNTLRAAPDFTAMFGTAIP